MNLLLIIEDRCWTFDQLLLISLIISNDYPTCRIDCIIAIDNLEVHRAIVDV